MREPQVDTFCRCVKKVKKTLKAERGKKDRSAAEGRAIAICTKSVLQTKGRTLRKVRCRDHLLETQSMKSGRRTRAERREVQEAKEQIADINRTRVVYVKNSDVRTPEGTERIIGMPVGESDALKEMCMVDGNETIEQNYLARVPHADALVLFFGKKHQVDILRAKHPHGNLPINKGKGFAIINFDGERDLELSAICSHESTRGQGVGKDMLKFVESMAELNGRSRVVLDALPPAAPFYIKQGYVNTHTNYYAKELKPQEGGVFKWAGADTPVFNKDPVGDWNGFPVMWVDPKEVDKAKQEERQKQLNALITKYDAVVRMVSAGDGEIPIHRMLKGMIKDNVPPFDSPFVKMHVNLWAGSGIYRVDEEKTYDKVLLQNDARKTANLEHIITRFGSFKWYGLVARTQKADVSALKGDARIKALCALLRVLLHIDGRIVHYDLHTGNMAVMNDNTPVIHDVGRMKIRDVLADFAPWEVSRPGPSNKRILRNVLMPIFEWTNENMEYGQYFYIARFFKDLRKGIHNKQRFYGEDDHGESPAVPRIQFTPETFPAPTEKGGWVHNDMPANKANKEAFQAWLDQSSGPGGDKLPQRKRYISWILGPSQKGIRVYDASGNEIKEPTTASGPFLFLDPPVETRYHQIARVFDILSVLKALSRNMRDDTVAYYYARKTAVKIINLLSTSPPTATKENINKTIRAYLELTGTRNDYDGNTPEDEEYWATKYLDEVNDARSGPKGSAVAAPAPAPAPGADADAKAKLQVALKAAAEASEAIEVGAPPPPDPLNDAAVSAGIIAELDAIPIPVQLALDEAVTDASEIVRQSEEEDNSKVLIETGMILSPDDVAAEARVEAPTDNGEGAPKIKRLTDLAAAKEEVLVDAADLAEPLRNVLLPIKGGRRTFRRKGLPRLL